MANYYGSRRRVAWARYGSTGAMLAGSLSKTHLTGSGAVTYCGKPIPGGSAAGADWLGYAVYSSGSGKCKRCFGR